MKTDKHVHKDAKKDWILDQMKAGFVDRKVICPKFCKIFKCSVSSFDGYYRKAKPAFAQYNEALNVAKTAKSMETEIKAVEGRILDKNERLEIASAIASSPKANNGDRIRAMDYISKIQGEYITKVASTDTEGKDKPTGFVVGSMDEFLAAIKGK